MVGGVIGLALLLIIAGLLMAFLCKYLHYPLLVNVVFFVGVVLVAIGLVLLLARPIVWIDGHLRAMLGQG